MKSPYTLYNLIVVCVIATVIIRKIIISIIFSKVEAEKHVALRPLFLATHEVNKVYNSVI